MDNYQKILDELKSLLPPLIAEHWINDYLDYDSFKESVSRDPDFAKVDFTAPMDEPDIHDIASDIKHKLMGNEFMNVCQQISGKM